MPDTAEPRLYAPSLEPDEEWWDVILHFHTSHPANAENGNNPPISERFTLAPNIWIERLDAVVARHIAEACSPRNFNLPIQGQLPHTYAFVRKSRCPGLFEDTGGLDELWSVLNLSRIIRPTTMGNRFAARVSIVNGVVKQVMSYQPKGAMLDVFSPKVSEQDWLGIPEAERLRSLMPWIITRELLPRRVHNAYWHHEYAMRTYYVDHRWSFVCTALEALVHSNRNGSTAQFVHRVGLLGGGQGITFTEAELVRAYELRSGLVHGSQFLSEQARLTDEELDLYHRLEDTLRAVLLRALEDRSFAANFTDEAAIDAFMPMPPKRMRPKGGSSGKS